MWNDEDNNPYGTSLDHGDIASSPGVPSSPPGLGYAPFGGSPGTPSSGSGDEAPVLKGQHGFDDVFFMRDATAHDELRNNKTGTTSKFARRTKPNGYGSRVEQFLYEHPEIPILITSAGKSPENNGRFIVYTIRTGDDEVRRRYSEFASLRDALTRLHPTLIIPPIPDKHTMADYAANPTNAKQDQHIIDLRKRMLAVFLNRCRQMEEILTDGVWWRFLDPNASWSEVLNAPPLSNIPKSILKAPPLDPANPTSAHQWLPVPSNSARLKPNPDIVANAIGETGTPGLLSRLPEDSRRLSEEELDAYFDAFETSVKDLEQLLTGPIEKLNRRSINHLDSLVSDQFNLGVKFNAFSITQALRDQDPLAHALEKVGQAMDHSALNTEDLSRSLGAHFAEPMRENAQFAGVVRNVLRYRVLRRVQQDMTMEELEKKRALLSQLERSESEARRIDEYLNASHQYPASPQKTVKPTDPSPSVADATPSSSSQTATPATADDDTASIDSDFPPTHGDPSSVPSAEQGMPEQSAASIPLHRKIPSGSSITNKIFGPLRHAIQGVADVDPERTRRDTIGKTRESITQLEQAQVVVEQDVKDASAGILADMKRFQGQKEEDLRRYMLAYARSQVEWARKNREMWKEAQAEVGKVDEE